MAEFTRTPENCGPKGEGRGLGRRHGRWRLIPCSASVIAWVADVFSVRFCADGVFAIFREHIAFHVFSFFGRRALSFLPPSSGSSRSPHSPAPAFSRNRTTVDSSSLHSPSSTFYRSRRDRYSGCSVTPGYCAFEVFGRRGPRSTGNSSLFFPSTLLCRFIRLPSPTRPDKVSTPHV